MDVSCDTTAREQVSSFGCDRPKICIPVFAKKSTIPRPRLGRHPPPLPQLQCCRRHSGCRRYYADGTFFCNSAAPPELSQTNIEVGVARGTAPNTRMMRWYFISQKPDLDFTPLGTCQRRSRLPQWGHPRTNKDDENE